MIAIPIKRWSKENTLFVLLMLLGLTGGALAFTPSYFTNLNVLIGLCLFPFTLLLAGGKRNNLLYVALMVLSAALAVTYKIRICYFFCLAFYFLWLIELFVGRLSGLILFLILFMSPFFVQVVTILGFPLRLTLSKSAGDLLNVAGLDVQVEGNMMILRGVQFSVDEACMGLNMLAISLLMGVFILTYRSRVSKTILRFYPTAVFFAVAFALNMVTNVIRIIVLVVFQILPENPMHEFIGLLCLVAYVVVPLHYFSGWLLAKYGQPKSNSASMPVLTHSNAIFMAILQLLVVFVGAKIEKTRHAETSSHADIHFGSVEPVKLNDGITKISTDDLLIYVKNIPEFFTGEHTPLMCWKGSGYEFSGIETTKVAGVTIYKGALMKDESLLYTAWWYSNGEVETISQVDWRMRMLKGEPDFCLVNVTAGDEQILMTSIETMFNTDALSINVER